MLVFRVQEGSDRGMTFKTMLRIAMSPTNVGLEVLRQTMFSNRLTARYLE